MKKTIAIIAIATLCACSPKTEKKIHVTDPQTGKKTEVTVSKGAFSNDIKIEGENGQGTVNITEGKVSSAMPDYIKPYPGAREINSLHATGDSINGKDKKGEAVTLGFTSDDEPNKIIEHYEKEMVGHGFSKKGSMNMGQMSMASLVNEKEHQALQIIATKENGKATQVQLILAKEE